MTAAGMAATLVVASLSAVAKESAGILSAPAIFDDPADPTVASMIDSQLHEANSNLASKTSRQLRMHLIDADTLATRLFATSTVRYFEWGSGGSTELASASALHKTSNCTRKLDSRIQSAFELHSVDDSAEWLSSLSNDSTAIREAQAKGYLALYAADVGKTGGWGHPLNWESRPEGLKHKQGTEYVDKIDAPGGTFDLVLIDGRFRAACALKALQHVASNSTVLVHDFYDGGGTIQRKQYAMLLDWYDSATPGTRELAVLTPKPEALVAAAQLSHEYMAALMSEHLDDE